MDSIKPLRIVERLPHIERRANWQAGPWSAEPDRIEWRDAASGYPCLIVRNVFGALCGYVGLPPDHPMHGKECDEVDFHVHGGLTFADACHPPICHVSQPGEPEHVWWLGFDCAHSGDLCPGISMRFGDTPRAWESYKSVAYVQDQVTSLAQQLWALATPPLPSAPAREGLNRPAD